MRNIRWRGQVGLAKKPCAQGESSAPVKNRPRTKHGAQLEAVFQCLSQQSRRFHSSHDVVMVAPMSSNLARTRFLFRNPVTTSASRARVGGDEQKTLFVVLSVCSASDLAASPSPPVE